MREGLLAVGPPPIVIDNPNDIRRSGGAVLLTLRSLPVFRRDLDDWRVERAEFERDIDGERRAERDRPPVDVEADEDDEKSRNENRVDGLDAPAAGVSSSPSASLLREIACRRD